MTTPVSSQQRGAHASPNFRRPPRPGAYDQRGPGGGFPGNIPNIQNQQAQPGIPQPSYPGANPAVNNQGVYKNFGNAKNAVKPGGPGRGSRFYVRGQGRKNSNQANQANQQNIPTKHPLLAQQPAQPGKVNPSAVGFIPQNQQQHGQAFLPQPNSMTGLVNTNGGSVTRPMLQNQHIYQHVYANPGPTTTTQLNPKTAIPFTPANAAVSAPNTAPQPQQQQIHQTQTTQQTSQSSQQQATPTPQQEQQQQQELLNGALPPSPGKSSTLCRYFASTGFCYYGDQCNFAHASTQTQTQGGAATTTAAAVTTSAAVQAGSMGPYVPGCAGTTPGSLPKSRRLCRNITLHGFCKFQNKGCEYNHDVLASEAGGVNPLSPPRLGAPIQPDVSTPTAGGWRGGGFQPNSMAPTTFTTFNTGTPAFYPSGTGPTTVPGAGLGAPSSDGMGGPVLSSQGSLSSGSLPRPGQQKQIGPDVGAMSGLSLDDPNGPQVESIGGTVYFYQNTPQTTPQKQPRRQTPVRPPPTFLGFPNPPSHLAPPRVAQNPAASFFMPDDILAELAHRNACLLTHIDPNVETKGVLQEVDNYHTLYPLEQAGRYDHKLFGYPTDCYKATNTYDGLTYCLRRVKGFHLTNEKAMGAVEQWKKIQHASIVGVKEAFTTKEFGDHSLVFVYDFHPAAETLMGRYFETGSGEFLVEPVLWSYIIQLTSAVRMVHAANLAVRMIDPSKILITGKNRVRINCAGILDVLTYDGTQKQSPVPHYQQEDLLGLGRLILALSCNSMPAQMRDNLNQSLEHVAMHYSNDLKNLIVYLLSSPQHGRLKSVNDLMPMVGARFYTELECAHLHGDRLETELGKELENGRLFRLISKLGFINERPEFDMDPAWSETGDRYLLKLFRDYVFHQVNQEGEPVISLAHVVHCLNKLDIGSSERVCLVSRDEQSVLVVSYKDLKRCVENAFNELAAVAATV